MDKVMLPGSGCNGCRTYTATHGDSAIVTADSVVRFFRREDDGLWALAQTISIGSTSRLVPAISGNTSVFGAQDENGYVGAAYVYERVSGEETWQFQQKFTPEGAT